MPATLASPPAFPAVATAPNSGTGSPPACPPCPRSSAGGGRQSTRARADGWRGRREGWTAPIGPRSRGRSGRRAQRDDRGQGNGQCRHAEPGPGPVTAQVGPAQQAGGSEEALERGAHDPPQRLEDEGGGHRATDQQPHGQQGGQQRRRPTFQGVQQKSHDDHGQLGDHDPAQSAPWSTPGRAALAEGFQRADTRAASAAGPHAASSVTPSPSANEHDDRRVQADIGHQRRARARHHRDQDGAYIVPAAGPGGAGQPNGQSLAQDEATDLSTGRASGPQADLGSAPTASSPACSRQGTPAPGRPARAGTLMPANPRRHARRRPPHRRRSTTNGSAMTRSRPASTSTSRPSPTARSTAVTGVGISNASFSVLGEDHDRSTRGHPPRYRPTDR